MTPATNTGLSPSGYKVWVLALACIVAGALYLRLFGLTAIGVGGNDTILYYTLAEQWLKGNFVYRIGESVQVFRPVLLGFNALALKVFGHSDYAIKLANTLLDVGNLLLLSLLAWLISRRRVVVLASAGCYALLPIAVWSARQELPHTLSTFFSLSAYLLVWQATCGIRGQNGHIPAFLAGLCVGAAALTHEDLIFLAVPGAVFLLLAGRLKDAENRPGLDLAGVAMFSAAPAVAVAMIMYFESATVHSLVSASVGAVANNERVLAEVFARFLWDGIVGSTSAAMAIVLAFCICYFCWQIRPGTRERDPDITLWLGFCVITPVSFVMIYALFFTTFFPRGFLPLLPLLIIAVFQGLAIITGGMGRAASGVIVVVMLAVITLSNLASYAAFNVANRRFSATWAEPMWPTRANLERGYQEFVVDARYVPSYATHWRALFQAFDGKVDAGHRLLIMPSTVFYAPGRRALQTDVYFGDNAIYRLDHAHQSLSEIVSKYRIKFLVFTVGQQRGVPVRHARYLYNDEWANSEPLDLAEAYDMDAYSVQAEYQALLEYLRAAEARQVFPFPRDSYQARTTVAWILR